MEIPNIYTVIDRSDPHRTGARSAFQEPCPVALLLLPGDLDKPEQQECLDHRERGDGHVASVEPSETRGSGENEGRDPGVPD